MIKKEVKILLRRHKLKWNDFEDFIFCQTVGITKDGEYDYYEWDVERFIRNNKRK